MVSPAAGRIGELVSTHAKSVALLQLLGRPSSPLAACPKTELGLKAKHTANQDAGAGPETWMCSCTQSALKVDPDSQSCL